VKRKRDLTRDVELVKKMLEELEEDKAKTRRSVEIDGRKEQKKGED
jgi:hypothetical protein